MPSAGRGGHLDRDLAFARELDGVGHQIQHDLPQSSAVAAHALGHVAGDLQLEAKPLGLGEQPSYRAGLVDRVAQPEVDRVELELSGFDLRDVEDLVDDRHHVLARAGDLLGVAALLVVQVGVEQQLVHPDHAVHRRPDLVAHVREERGLHLGRSRRLRGLFLELDAARPIDLAQLRGLEHERALEAELTRQLQAAVAANTRRRLAADQDPAPGAFAGERDHDSGSQPQLAHQPGVVAVIARAVRHRNRVGGQLGERQG